MPKNKKGGKKFRGKKKSSKNGGADGTERRLEFKSEGQEYARVIKLLGNRRITAVKNDGTEILCIIPGKFKSRVWINKDDVILVTVRSFQSDKADVIYKYFPDEVKRLTKMGHLSRHIVESRDIVNNKADDSGVVFDEDSEDKDSDNEDSKEKSDEINLDEL